jgi:DNA-binding transcriptional LysR family regulator
MAANYQHLRAFHAIAVDGGVSRAARRLHVSQPTLSQQLKALEARHGVALFESRKAPLTLTAAGRELFTLTQKLFSVASDIDDVLGEKTAVTGGMFRLGSDNPFYAAKVTEVLRRRHPQIQIQVRMGNARDVMRWLGDAQIDAALASDPPGEGGFSYEPLSSDTLACALPIGHSLVALDAIPMHAFAGETLLLREANSKTRAFTERALADAGVTPRAVIELQSRETIREGIALGLGISAFFSSECPPDVRIAYRPLDTREGEYRLRNYLVYQNDRRRSPLMRSLRTIVDEIKIA